MEQMQIPRTYKVIAWILCVCLVITLVPEIAFAKESAAEKPSPAAAEQQTSASKEDVEVTEKDVIEEEKTTDTTTYDLGGGEKMTVFHGGEVRYEDEKGELVDYDPSLVKIKDGEKTEQNQSLEDYAYENKEGDKKQYLPKTLSEETPVLMEYKDYRIEFAPTDQSLAQTGVDQEPVEIQKEIIPTAYEQEAALPVDAVYGEGSKAATLAYTSSEHGVKETLTLEKKPENNVFTYKIKLKGMTARKNVTDEGITYYDQKTGEIAGYITAPWMNDASGKAYSEAITYDLEPFGGEGEYLLIMTIDEDYLSDPGRQYPVTIDPSNTWQGSAEVKDAYVISGSKYSNTNFYESGTKVMPAGKNSTGTHRTFIKFTDLTKIVKNQSVTSAKLTVWETGSGASKQKVGVRRIKESWSLGSVTWKKRPAITGAIDTITTKKTAKSAHSFNVLSFVKGLAAGSFSNYGLAINNETSSPSYACFYGSRTSSSSYRPKLVCTYYSKPTTATSASISPASVKTSTAAKIYYGGITSTGLNRVEYRVDRVTCGTARAAYWGYTSARKAGSGMVLPSLPSGCYQFYVRGVNNAGTAGAERGTNVVHVDNVSPTLGSISLTNTAGTSIHGTHTNETNPKIDFSGVTDTHINASCLTYAIAKAGETPVYKAPASLSISSAKPYSGSFRLTATDQALATGAYTIYVKATDTLGNETIKQLSYLKDVSKPTGSIKVTEAGTGQEIEVMHDTVNIIAELNSTGSKIKTSSLKLYKLSKTIGEDGTESVTEAENASAEIFTNVTTTKEKDTANGDLDTSAHKNGNYRLKLELEDIVGYKNTITKDIRILNPIGAPSVSAEPTNTGTAEVAWSFEKAKGLKAVQYKVGQEGEWKKGCDASAEEKEGTFDAVLPDEDGIHRIYVRGLDEDGEVGKETVINCLYDRGPPTVVLKDFAQGYLKGTITDAYDLGWKLFIKEKEAEDTAYELLFEKNNKIEDANIEFIDLSVDKYTEGTEYTVKVEATDRAGNRAEKTLDIYKAATGTSAKMIEAAFRIQRPDYQSYNTKELLLPTSTESLRLKKKESEPWPQGTTDWYINNKFVGSGETYSDDFSTAAKDGKNAKYEEGKPYPVLAVHRTESGKRFYSSNVVRNGILQEVKLSGQESSDAAITKELTFGGKAVSLRIAENWRLGQAEGVTYALKTGDHEFTAIQPDKTYTVAELFEGMAYAENATLQIDPGSSTSMADINVELDILAPETEEHFRLSSIENYRPEKVSVSDKINYKTYIKWENKITEDTPENICYEVYRGTEKDFVPSPSNLAATDIRAGYFTEMNVNYRGNFYYKVRAVKKSKEQTAASSYSDQVYSRVVDGNEYTKRMGVKEYWEFAEIESPAGDISIEKSMGNLVFSQTDAEIPNEQLEVELSRTYNSQSTAKSAFGVGWSHDFDMELLNICKGNELNYDNVVLKDGSGTIYHFIKQADGSYSSSLGKYINLKKEEKSEDVKLPERKAGIAGADEKKTVTVKSSFTMETKDDLEYRFNSGGQLVYMQEPNGNFLLFEYEPEKGLLSKAVTSKNLAMEFAYNNQKGQDPLTVKTLTLPDKSTVEYHYEGDPAEENVRLTEAVVRSGNEEISYRYGYDTSEVPNVDKIYDAEGNLYEIEYDAEDRASEARYPDGDAVRLTYGQETAAAAGVTAEEAISVENLGLTTSTTTSKVTKGEVVSSEKDTFNGYGNCIKSVDAEGYVTTYTYQNHLLHQTTTEVDSHYVDAEGYVKATTPKKRKTETTTYDKEENEQTEKEEDGSVTSYEYDENAGPYTDDLPVKETEVDGDGKPVFDLTYQYDELGNETREYDAVSDTTTVTEYYQQDGKTKLKGEVKKETEYLGTPESGKIQSSTTYEYLYGEDGSKTEKTTQTCGDTTITTTAVYDNMGREISSTDSRGKKTDNEYDGFGRLIKTIYTDGDIVTRVTKEYDKNGALRKETAEDGTVTEYTYDNMNRVISRTVTKGGFSKTWTTGYDYATVDIHTGKGPSDTVRVKNAFVTTERNPDGEITSQSYQDHLGRNVRELENGIYVDMTYDGQGNVLTQYELGAEQTDDKGLLTMFIYDDAGNKTHTVLNPTYDADKGFYTRGEAIVQASTYDKSGNETSSTDGEGNTTKFTYDEEGNITSATLPDGTTTKYEYDKVNADGTTSDFTIDPLGRKSEVKKDEGDLEVEVADLGKNAPDPIKTRYQYDAKENVTRETDSEGNYRTYVYDGRDRKVAANYFDKSGKQTLKTTYEYDISDNVTLMCDYTVENGKEILLRYTKYSYDSLKRLVGMAELDGPAVPTAEEIEKHMLRYTYDIDDNLTAIDYPDTGSKVKGLRFTYNQHKWLTAVHADTGGLLDEKVRDYVYGNDGKLLQIKDYKGVLSGGLGYIQRDYTYDAFERPTGMEYKDSDNFSAARESYAYTYDKNNNILTERIINGYPEKAEEKTDQLRAHTYDSLGRLTSTTITDNGSGKAQNIAYEYDDAGNRVKEIKDGIVTDYDYNDFNQLASSQKTQGEEKLSEKTYAYDKNGNQLSETDKITGESRSMTYDAAGSLGRLVVKKGNTIELTQENLYNGNGQRIQKTEADRTTRYYYQGSSVLYTRDGMNALTSQNLLGTGDNVIATTRGAGDAESYYIYNKDVRESTSNVLDDCGQSQVSYEYDDFGETKVKGNQDFYNEICYTGGIHDASTGLYYLNARYYDPENANFLSQDTYRGEKDDPESLNLYAYCNNNPASYTDPTGHFPWVVAGIWAYRGIKAAYKGYKVYKKAKKVYKAAKTVKKTYRAAKTYRKASSTYRSARRTYKTYKKVKRTYSKPKVT
ncbi:MAG: DNRLRE domain-containing protein, partial [Clostridiales Family XIII bacterium]|nr:DNRLRE domain-containing protein [Clostridiales Family XIII bacterium]